MTTGVGLGLWSAITLPARLIMGILSGTWYFISEPEPLVQRHLNSHVLSLNVHAVILPPLYAAFPSSTNFGTYASASSRSYDNLTLLCSGSRALHRLFGGDGLDA